MEIEQDTAAFRYMDQVQRIPRLSREQEAELCRRWRSEGDQQAKDDLVRANLRFVAIIALKYRRYGLPLSDLVAEGNLGLLHAVDKFEPERGLRFLTYAAYWIRAHILSTITRSWSLVGGGTGALRSKLFFKLRREKARVVNWVGEGDAALDLLAKRFDASREQMAEMTRRLEVRDVYFDSYRNEDGQSPWVENLQAPDCDQEQAYASCERDQRTREMVQGALRALDSRERFIIEHRLMKDVEDALTLAELGRRLGVTRERARQLEVRAMYKLRQNIPGLSNEDNTTSPFGSAA